MLVLLSLTSWIAVTAALQASNDARPAEPDEPAAESEQETPKPPPAWRWTYDVRNRTGYRLERPRVFQMARTMANVKGVGRLSERWRLTTEGRAHYDPVGRLGYPKTLWFDPRQFLLDGRAGPVSLSLGLQQVVWGQADGLRILDVINPLDYREFILEDFLDSRRPLWMARADVPFVRRSSLQLIWIPYFAPGRVPTLENEFGLGAAFGSGVFNLWAPGVPLPSLTVRSGPVRRPPYRWSSSQVGARWGRTVYGWDLTANVFHGWEDIATPDVALAIARPRPPPSGHPSPAWKPELDLVGGVSAGIGGHYDRKTVFGTTAANNLGPVVLRAEAGWTAHRPALVNSFPATAPFQRFGQFSGVIGLDYAVRPWLWTSGQYFLQFTSAPRSVLFLPRYTHLISYHIRGEFFRDTLRPEFFVLAGLNQRQYLLRPRLTRAFGDHWTVALGADFFGGRADSLLGFYATRDRAVLEVKWAR